MQILQTFPRAFTAAAVLAFAASSQASVVFVSTQAAFSAITSGAGTDNFNDLTINEFITGPLNRSAGLFGYTARTTAGDFYVAPVAGTRALAVELSTGSIVLDNFSRAVFGLGGNFFNTNVLGEFTGGGITLSVLDVNGGMFNNTFTPANFSSFAGFLSDTRVRSVTVSNASTGSGPWETIDNLTLAVPEPGSVALSVLALGLAVGVSRRRATRALDPRLTHARPKHVAFTYNEEFPNDLPFHEARSGGCSRRDAQRSLAVVCQRQRLRPAQDPWQVRGR